MYHFQSSRLFLAMLFLFSAMFAQTDSTEVYNNSLKKGSKSLQFRVTNNFTLSSFDGSDLSIKRHTSAKSAQRLGIGIIANFDSNDGGTINENGGIRSQDSDATSSEFDISMNVLWLKYFSPDKRMSFYWGVGPSGGFTLDNGETTNTNTFQDASMSIRNVKTDRTSFSVGGDLVFGTEFFLHKKISLTAEYRSSNSFIRITEDRNVEETDSFGNESTQESNVGINRFSLGSSTAYLGLSAYF